MGEFKYRENRVFETSGKELLILFTAVGRGSQRRSSEEHRAGDLGATDVEKSLCRTWPRSIAGREKGVGNILSGRKRRAGGELQKAVARGKREEL